MGRLFCENETVLKGLAQIVTNLAITLTEQDKFLSVYLGKAMSESAGKMPSVLSLDKEQRKRHKQFHCSQLLWECADYVRQKYEKYYWIL